MAAALASVLPLLTLSPNAPLDRTDYCAIKALALSYAAQRMPSRNLSLVYDALQLGLPPCSIPPPSPFAPAMRLREANFGDALHVDCRNGADDHNGTIDFPLRTLEAALARRRRSGAQDIVVRGQCHVSSTLELDSRDDGIIVRGHAGEDAQISGGVSLDGLQWRAWRGQVMVATVPDTLDVGNLSELYVDGRRAIRARWPNANCETQGLYTPAHTGYASAAAVAFGRPLSQSCHDNVSCPLSVPNFVYGTYHAASEAGAGFVPSFVPFWCGKWAGTSGVVLNDTSALAAAGAHVQDWDVADGRAELHMTKGETDIWGNVQWSIESVDRSGNSTAALRFSKGGYQFPAGIFKPGFWFVDNVLAELDAELEYFWEPSTRRLFFRPNASWAEDWPSHHTLVGSRLATIVRATGARVAFANLTFAHTERSYLADYEIPSGGGYSLHRGAMVELRDAPPGTAVEGCLFDGVGGNGLLVEGNSTGVRVAGNEFRWIGDTAIVILGEAHGCDARGSKGRIPNATVIEANLIHDVGIYGLQGCGVFQALAMHSTIVGNIIFNGPRAGVLWNDGLGGGNRLESNLMFNLCRESTDHGPFNSWDRIPYETTDVTTGEPRLGPALNRIKSNLIICNYECTWPIDHDDGSNTYEDSYNVLVYGGAKNYLGHSKRSHHNLYVYPDAKPIEGAGPGLTGFQACAQSDGNKKGSSGWGEVFDHNRCVLYNDSASIYHWGSCDPAALNDTTDTTHDNSFFGSNLRVTCGAANWSLDEWQRRGRDERSVAAPTPPLATLLGWARAMLNLTQ